MWRDKSDIDERIENRKHRRALKLLHDIFDAFCTDSFSLEDVRDLRSIGSGVGRSLYERYMVRAVVEEVL